MVPVEEQLRQRCLQCLEKAHQPSPKTAIIEVQAGADRQEEHPSFV